METFSALVAICVGNSPVTGEFPAQRPVTRSFDVFFDLRPNKRFSKQSWGWWFETPSRPLWRTCYVLHCHWQDVGLFVPTSVWLSDMHTTSSDAACCHLCNDSSHEYRLLLCNSAATLMPCALMCNISNHEMVLTHWGLMMHTFLSEIGHHWLI